MKIIEQLIELRRDILDVIGAVDANGGRSWDTTRPNSTTRAALNGLLDKHLLLGERFDGILHQTVDEYIASRSLSAGKQVAKMPLTIMCGRSNLSVDGCADR